MKSAFVAMPFTGKSGEEYEWFRELYENYIKNPLMLEGYNVVRADEVQKSGAITKEVIERLANSDLVIADLSESNPNVYYEVGVRHVLRKHGTILLLDTRRTPRVPFNLQDYRVIEYEGDMTRLRKLREALVLYQRSLGMTHEGDSPTRR